MAITIFYDNKFFSLGEEADSVIKPDDCQNQFIKFLEENKQNSYNFNCSDPTACLQKIKQICTTRSAGGGIVVNSEGKLLMITRFGIPDLPKGHIEAGESPEDAALREVQEECGILPDRTEKALVPSYHVFKEKKYFILKEVFWFQMRFCKQEKLLPQTEESITDAAWYGKEEVRKFRELTYGNLKPYLDYYLLKKW